MKIIEAGLVLVAVLFSLGAKAQGNEDKKTKVSLSAAFVHQVNKEVGSATGPGLGLGLDYGLNGNLIHAKFQYTHLQYDENVSRFYRQHEGASVKLQANYLFPIFSLGGGPLWIGPGLLLNYGDQGQRYLTGGGFPAGWFIPSGWTGLG